MKWFAILFSIYLLGLSLYPCQDGVSANHRHQTEYSQTSSQQTDSTDHCSPFCHCQCCSSPIIGVMPSFHPHNWMQSVGELRTTYIFQYYSSLFSSVWQPPELA